MAERGAIASGWTTRLVGALLCLGVAAVHVVDQGGVPGSKTPRYIAVLYYALEIVAVVTAVLLVVGIVRLGWFLALGVGAGPIVGYVLSRGPGLPDSRSDIGNWAERLGLFSLVIEGLLVVLSATCFLRRPRIDALHPGP
ncbi:hypothetical protein ACGFWD_40855 [Streptomyces sp. NPDC048448]|uniref:hypothetical protein n=1 Tax=unclassified Streptomyces TaxID=2593676 RepID=UPI00371B03DB